MDTRSKVLAGALAVVVLAAVGWWAVRTIGREACFDDPGRDAEFHDGRRGKIIRTAPFLPGEDVNTDGDTTQIAVADDTLIAEVGNLTLAFDLPGGG